MKRERRKSVVELRVEAVVVIVARMDAGGEKIQTMVGRRRKKKRVCVSMVKRRRLVEKRSS